MPALGWRKRDVNGNLGGYSWLTYSQVCVWVGGAVIRPQQAAVKLCRGVYIMHQSHCSLLYTAGSSRACPAKGIRQLLRLCGVHMDAVLV